MKLKLSFKAILITVCLFSCSYPNEQKNISKEDSIKKSDSIRYEIEKQRILDSIEIVTKEQQIIADSIQHQVVNQ